MNWKAGNIARVRVNPKDCMAIVDLCRVAGLNPYDYSFSGAVSLVLSSLLNAQRKAGTIEERSGFEYSEMVGPWQGTKSTYQKRAMTDAIYYGAAQGMEPPVIPQREPAQQQVLDNPETVGFEGMTDEEVNEAILEYQTLTDLRNSTGLTQEEADKYDQLSKFFGL